MFTIKIIVVGSIRVGHRSYSDMVSRDSYKQFPFLTLQLNKKLIEKSTSLLVNLNCYYCYNPMFDFMKENIVVFTETLSIFLIVFQVHHIF